MINALKKTFLAIFALTFFVSIPSQLSAQEAEDNVNVALTIYRKTFVNSYIIPSMITGEAKAKKVEERNHIYWIQSAGKWISFDMSANAAQKKVQYIGSANLKIYQNIGDAEKPNYKSVATVAIPQGASELAILMFVRKNSINFYPVDLSPQNIPKGKLVIMNMTSIQVGVAVDDNKKKGQANKKGTLINSLSHIVITLPSQEKKSVPVEIYVRKKQRNGKYNWIVRYKGSVLLNRDQKNILLLYDPFEKKKANINVQALYF